MTKTHTNSTETVRYEICGGGGYDPYTFYLDADEFAMFTAKAESGTLDGETYGNFRITATRLTKNVTGSWSRETVWTI